MKRRTISIVLSLQSADTILLTQNSGFPVHRSSHLSSTLARISQRQMKNALEIGTWDETIQNPRSMPFSLGGFLKPVGPTKMPSRLLRANHDPQREDGGLFSTSTFRHPREMRISWPYPLEYESIIHYTLDAFMLGYLGGTPSWDTEQGLCSLC
jgi:hypothetical protein